MALPTGDIQTALISRYRGDTTLTAMLASNTAVYDAGGVPTNQAFPYVVLYPITSQTGTTLAMGQDAVDSYIQVSVFTQYGGMKQARDISKRIYSLTQTTPVDLSASGFSQFFVRFESEQELPQSDGITQQIVHRYHFMTQSLS